MGEKTDWKTPLIVIGAVVVVAIIVFAIVSIKNKQPIEKDEFSLSEDNFDLVSLSHSPNALDIDTSIEGVCAQYKMYVKGELPYDWKETYQKNEFIITYNVKDDSPYYLEPLSCYTIVEGIKYYGKIYEKGVQEKSSNDFCDNPNYHGEVGETCWYARADITKSTDVTLCCNGICKTKTLPAYCLV